MFVDGGPTCPKPTFWFPCIGPVLLLGPKNGLWATELSNMRCRRYSLARLAPYQLDVLHLPRDGDRPCKKVRCRKDSHRP